MGNHITISDNRRICSHAAECVNNLSSVFRFNARPWISPNAADREEIISAIKKCPSGALSYSIDGIEYQDQNNRIPQVTVSKDGPNNITGGIEPIESTFKGQKVHQKNITLSVGAVLQIVSHFVTANIKR